MLVLILLISYSNVSCGRGMDQIDEIIANDTSLLDETMRYVTNEYDSDGDISSFDKQEPDLPETSTSCADVADSSFILCGGDIVIPNDLGFEIDAKLFWECTNEVTSINYGNNGTEVLPFDAIPTTVENIYASDDNVHFRSIDGVLFSHDGKNLIYFPPGRTGEYVIPMGCELLTHLAFFRSSLSSVYVPDSLKSMQTYVFAHAVNLTDISLPAGIDYHENIDMFPLKWVKTSDGMGGFIINPDVTVHYRGTADEWYTDFKNCTGAEYMNVVYDK